MASVTTQSGVLLEYECFGDVKNPPMLLIQGLGAQMIGWRGEFCQQLAAAGFYIIRFDNRDVGLSQKFPEQQYELSDMARDSAELLDELNIHAAHIVGQSMGGIIAQLLAAEYPDHVLSLTLFYTTAQIKFITGNEILTERASQPRATNRTQAAEHYIEAEALCSSPAYERDMEWLYKLGGLMWDRSYDVEGMARQRHAMDSHPDRRDTLKKISCPTLILHGDSDRLISHEGSIDVHACIGHSKLHIYSGMGHEIPSALWLDMSQRIKANTEDKVEVFNIS